jgi:inner membrane protein
VLPFLLTTLLQLFYRTWWRSRPHPTRLVSRQLLLLSTIAIWSHPILDTLNTYGVRWLMPISGTWYYGDTLFIVDPWVWGTLGLGVFLSRRRDRSHRPGAGRPARVAMVIVLGYVVAMAASGAAARTIIGREAESLSGQPVKRLMASPVAVSPLVRRFVIEQEGRYLVGHFHWLRRPGLGPDLRSFGKGQPTHPAVLEASKTEVGRRFLSWARFPTSSVEQLQGGQVLVHLIDLRYAEGPSEPFGVLSIPVTLRDSPYHPTDPMLDGPL